MPSQLDAPTSLSVFPLTPEHWSDLETLIGPRGACGGCWCMFWRQTRSEYDNSKGEANRQALKFLVDSGEPPGLIAYAAKSADVSTIAPVGWIAVALRLAYSALAHSRVLKPVDVQPVWSGLAWTEVRAADALDVLGRVARGDADLTIADSVEFSLGRHFFPDLRPAFRVAEAEAVAWAVSPHGKDLLPELESFFAEVEADGRLADILERNRRALVRFDRVDAASFAAGVRERRPHFQAWFQEAAAETGIDWRLLAAIGYQESRWDAAAVSPTGVQGIMMLTGETARRVGITDRADPRESILGGARYLQIVERTIPDRIPDPDRTWLTLAAYNVGYGHLEDARILTQRRGRDPDRWPDVRDNLPLLVCKGECILYYIEALKEKLN